MTTIEPRPSWKEQLQPKNWSLPVKLAAVVLVPTVLALALGVLRVSDQSRTADAFDRVNQVVEVEEQVSDLITRLQDERREVVEFVAVRTRQDDVPLRTAFDATDAARAAALAGQTDPTLLDSGTVGAQRQVENQYFRLVQLRRQVLTGANGAGDLIIQYGEIIAALLVFDNAVTRQLSDPQIGGLSQAIGGLGEAREQVSAEQALVTAVLYQNVLLAPQGDALQSAESRLAAATNVVRSVLSSEQQVRYTEFTGASATARQQLLQSVLTRGRVNLPISIAPQDWTAASVAVLDLIDAADSGARGELRAISTARQDDAANLAGINSVILLLALVLAALVTALVARALVRSLRMLRDTALEVAQRRLPDLVRSMREGSVPDVVVRPVPVTTIEEVGQVARAFDAVHSQAVRLAAEQATLQTSVSSMFTNLSRRSQTLVERQLQLIEQLEANEEDPDQLANLFQLDHLATRMRRNSENLLVLSGSELSRRASQPVPMVDVLRATVSEVEQYQRVVVQSPPQVEIVGRAATDLVHLLSELLDNATNFSAPDTQVVISTSRTSDGTVLVTISDQGVGMSPSEIIDANSRLEGAGTMGVSASRRMGLFVVGRLAARHGVEVRLGGDGPAVGTTASVLVPALLFVGSAPAASPPQPLRPAELPNNEFVPPQRVGPVDAARFGPRSGQDPVRPAEAPNGTVPNGAEPGRNGSTPYRPNDPAHRTAALPTRRPGQFLQPAPDRPAPPDDRESTRSDYARPPGAPLDRRPAEQGLGSSPIVESEPLPPRAVADGSDRESLGAGPRRPLIDPVVGSDDGRGPDSRATADVDPSGAAATDPARTDNAPTIDPVALGAAPVDAPAVDTPAVDAAVTEALPLNGSAPAPDTVDPTVAIPPPTPAEPAPTEAGDAAPAPEENSLFAPAVPAPTDFEFPRRIEDGDRSDGFDLGETTPIFEEIVSAWFRSNRLLPVSYDAPARRPDPAAHPDPGAQHRNGVDPPRPAQRANPVPPLLPARPADPNPSTGRSPSPLPRRRPPSGPSPTQIPRPPDRPAPVGTANAAMTAGPAPEPHQAADGVAVPSPTGFASPADAGWRATASIAESTGEGITAAGLPKRRPRARLVPGTASSAPILTPARSAEGVRGLLASYQQGVRQGREARVRPDNGARTEGSGESPDQDGP